MKIEKDLSYHFSRISSINNPGIDTGGSLKRGIFYHIKTSIQTPVNNICGCNLYVQIIGDAVNIFCDEIDDWGVPIIQQ